MNSYQGAVGLAFYKSNPLKHGGAVRSCPVLPCAAVHMNHRGIHKKGADETGVAPPAQYPKNEIWNVSARLIMLPLRFNLKAGQQ